jgi:pyruvate/2-oxoacid:ferredoxin oxidoreductase beta subunit
MSKQSIDTTKVVDAINNIRTINNSINQEFNALRSKMWPLNSWKGPTGTTAQTQMHELFKNNEARSAVMQNYTDTLERLVNPAYQEAESQNRSLANLFK